MIHNGYIWHVRNSFAFADLESDFYLMIARKSFKPIEWHWSVSRKGDKDHTAYGVANSKRNAMREAEKAWEEHERTIR